MPEFHDLATGIELPATGQSSARIVTRETRADVDCKC
jgi:hypothetical protein